MEGESMSEWKEVKLGDVILHSCSGGTPKSNVSEYYDGEIPWLNTKEIDFNRIYQTERNITQKGLDNSSAKWIDEKCVIIAMYGATAGKIAINMIPLTTNQACCNLKVDDRLADFRYIYYFLKKDFKFLASLANGGAQQNLNSQIIKDYVIKLPSLSIQKEISDLLWTIDAKIETNNKLNEKLEEMAQAIFKSWFVDFEPFKDKPFHETELGMIPEGWNVCCLGDITKQTKEKVGSNRFLKVLSPINTGELTLSEDYFTKQVYSKDISKYILVRKNNFAYNPARVNIGSLGRNEYDFDGCVSPVYVVFEVIEEYENFFDLFRRQKTFINSVISLAIGGVRQSLSYNDFSYIKLVVPPKNVIEKFNDIYAELDKLKKTKKIENARLASLRDTLLPRLMSGELIV